MMAKWSKVPREILMGCLIVAIANQYRLMILCFPVSNQSVAERLENSLLMVSQMP